VAGLAANFGSGTATNSLAQIAEADTIFLFGSNPTECHPIVGMHLKKGLRRGAKLIVADPRRIDMVDQSEIWLNLRPGSNIALINGMLHVILTNGWENKEYIAKRTEGFTELKATVLEYPPERVEKITGINEVQLRQAARMYAAEGRHAAFWGVGITHYVTGTDRVKSIANLAMLCGKIGLEGTGCNPLRGQNNVQGACDMGALFNTLPGYGGLENDALFDKYEKSWGIKLPRRPGKPATEVWENIFKGHIHGLYVFGEDPAVADANIAHVQAALEKVDFLVVQDIFLTATAKLADVVLPAACFAEKDGTFTCTERRVQRIRKAVEPPGEAKPDWKIFCELSKKMGYHMDYDSPEDIFNELRQLLPQYAGITYQRIEKVGLQWPVPSEDHPGTPVLHTETFTRGKGLFIPEDYLPPVELPDEEYPIMFTTFRDLARYNFSSMTGKTSAIDGISPECFAEIHPEDAVRLGITDKCWVRLTSRRGSVEMRATITDRTQEGTISATYNHLEALVNMLTLDALDRLSRTPEYKLCAIKVAVLGDELPG